MSGFWELLVLDPGPSGPGALWTRGVVGGYPACEHLESVMEVHLLFYQSESLKVRLKTGPNLF